jgi:hypothetical protein
MAAGLHGFLTAAAELGSPIGRRLNGVAASGPFPPERPLGGVPRGVGVASGGSPTPRCGLLFAEHHDPHRDQQALTETFLRHGRIVGWDKAPGSAVAGLRRRRRHGQPRGNPTRGEDGRGIGLVRIIGRDQRRGRVAGRRNRSDCGARARHTPDPAAEIAPVNPAPVYVARWRGGT